MNKKNKGSLDLFRISSKSTSKSNEPVFLISFILLLLLWSKQKNFTPQNYKLFFIPPNIFLILSKIILKNRNNVFKQKETNRHDSQEGHEQSNAKRQNSKANENKA